jgi:hypothetical protein
VDAGLGITLRTALGLPPSLAVLDALPPAPTIALCVHDARRELTPAASRLKNILIDTLTATLAGISQAASPIQERELGEIPTVILQHNQVR